MKTNKCRCKFCGGVGDKRYRGYCQACYRYFVTENKKLYPLYDPAEGPQYAPNGDCICPKCGKAFTKLGSHLYYAHGLSSDLYKEFGWNVRKKHKPSNISYRIHMKEVQDPDTIKYNLKEAGKSTRFNAPNGNSMALNSRVVKSRCSNCAYLYSKDGKSWDCDCYDKPCKYIIHCSALEGDKDETR